MIAERYILRARSSSFRLACYLWRTTSPKPSCGRHICKCSHPCASPLSLRHLASFTRRAIRSIFCARHRSYGGPWLDSLCILCRRYGLRYSASDLDDDKGKKASWARCHASNRIDRAERCSFVALVCLCTHDDGCVFPC